MTRVRHPGGYRCRRCTLDGLEEMKKKNRKNEYGLGKGVVAWLKDRVSAVSPVEPSWIVISPLDVF